MPVDLSEMSKLSGVFFGEAVGDSEAVPVSGAWPVTITPEPDDHGFACAGKSFASVASLDPSKRRIVSSMLDLCIELLAPSEVIDGGLHGTDPRQPAACGLSDYEARVLVRLRDVIRNPVSGHL